VGFERFGAPNKMLPHEQIKGKLDKYKARTAKKERNEFFVEKSLQIGKISGPRTGTEPGGKGPGEGVRSLALKRNKSKVFTRRTNTTVVKKRMNNIAGDGGKKGTSQSFAHMQKKLGSKKMF